MASNKQRKQTRLGTFGFSLVETLVVISTLLLLGTIVFLSFRAIERSEALSKTAINAVSLFDEARSSTLASLDGEQYGVYATTTYLALFRGSAYTEGASDNQILTLPSGVIVESIDFEPSEYSIVFEKLTGRAESVGTTTLGFGDGSDTKDIVIHRTGAVVIAP